MTLNTTGQSLWSFQCVDIT